MFIAFDGIDGAGKSTQIDLLVDNLKKRNISITRLDMGGTPFLTQIIKDINSRNIAVPPMKRELIYYYEGLIANLKYIRQTHPKDVIVIDRYYLSYYAYGLLNGAKEDMLDFLLSELIEPDIVRLKAF